MKKKEYIYIYIYIYQSSCVGGKIKDKNSSNPIFVLRVCLDRTYFIEIEN